MKVNQLLFKNEQGSALVMVLMLSMVFAILGTSLLYVGLQHHQNALRDELKLQAYYAAEAGVMSGIQQIKESSNRTIINSEDSLSSSPNVKFQLSNLTKNGSDYSFDSIGLAKLSDRLNAQVKITVKLGKNKPTEFQTVPFFNYSLFSNNSLVLGQEKIDFTNWKAEWRFMPFEFGLQSTDTAYLKNKITIEGDIYSADQIKLYEFDTINKKYPNQYLGMKPIVNDAKITTPSGSRVYKTGYNISYNRFFFLEFYKVDDPSIDSLLTNEQLNNFGENLVIQKKNEGVFSKVFEGLDREISNKQGQYNMRTVSGDLHITKDNEEELKGWIHVPGNLIIDEGVEIDNLRDLLVLVDGGIIIGAKQRGIYSEIDLPVKLKGQNIMLISKSTTSNNWLNLLKTISPIRNRERNYPFFFNLFEHTSYTTESFMNDYLDNPSQLSVVVNENSEIDGWLIGKEDVVMDYKISNSTEIESNPPTVKISGGVIGDKILFPKAIEIAKDLYIYDWKVEYQ